MRNQRIRIGAPSTAFVITCDILVIGGTIIIIIDGIPGGEIAIPLLLGAAQ